jgi:hypothetical protein
VSARRPTLVIRLPLEGDVVVRLEAATIEDERRLRSWLRRTRRLELLQHALQGILDDLDALDERRAA